ncbi:MAG: DUF481 domain-containing protein [Bacteroidales bacterium]|nr:DUF481 domain-containing protein [Bacteroidales bacterium]
MKNNIKFGLTVLASLFVFNQGFSQVNTEKFRKYSEKEGLLFNTSFRFGYSGGNSEYVSADGIFRLDYNGKKNDAFIVANYDYKESQSSKVTHKGFVHLRGIRQLSETIEWEGFLQQEFNEFILLEDRKLIGSGLRLRLLDYISEKDSLSGFGSNFGAGIMYEYEVYDINTEETTNITLDPFRLSTYLTLDWTLSGRVNLWAVGYFQPNIKSIKDFRSVIETGMEIWVIDKLYFIVDFSYRYNNIPVGDVKNYDLVIKNGLRYSIP